MSTPNPPEGDINPPNCEAPEVFPLNVHSPKPTRPSPIYLDKSFPILSPTPPPPAKDTPHEPTTPPRDYFSKVLEPGPCTPSPHIQSYCASDSSSERTIPDGAIEIRGGKKSGEAEAAEEEFEDVNNLTDCSDSIFVRHDDDGGSVFGPKLPIEQGKSTNTHDGDKNKENTQTGNLASAPNDLDHPNSSQEFILGIPPHEPAQSTTSDKRIDADPTPKGSRPGSPSEKKIPEESVGPKETKEKKESDATDSLLEDRKSRESRFTLEKCLEIRRIAVQKLKAIGIEMELQDIPFSRPETEALGFRWTDITSEYKASYRAFDRGFMRPRPVEDHITIQYIVNSCRIGTCPETWTKRERDIIFVYFNTGKIEAILVEETIYGPRRENVPWTPPIIVEPEVQKASTRKKRKLGSKQKSLDPFVKLEDFPSPSRFCGFSIPSNGTIRNKMEAEGAQEGDKSGIVLPDITEVLAGGPPVMLNRLSGDVKLFDEIESGYEESFETIEEEDEDEEEVQKGAEEVSLLSEVRSFASVSSQPTLPATRKRANSEPFSFVESDLERILENTPFKPGEQKGRTIKGLGSEKAKEAKLPETPRRSQTDNKLKEKLWNSESKRDSIAINLEALGLIETPESKRKRAEKKALKALQGGSPKKPPRWPFHKRLHSKAAEIASIDEVMSKVTKEEAPPRQVPSMLNEIGLTDKQKKRITLHKCVSDPLLLNTVSGQIVKEELQRHRITTSSSEYAESVAKTVHVVGSGSAASIRRMKFWRNRFNEVTDFISPPASLKSPASIRKFKHMDIGSLLYANQKKLAESRRLHAHITEKLRQLEATITSMEFTQPFLCRQLATIENYMAIATRKHQEFLSLPDNALGNNTAFGSQYQAEFALLRRQAEVIEEVMNITACEYMALQDDIVELQEKYKLAQEEVSKLQRGILRFGEIWKQTLTSYTNLHNHGSRRGGKGGDSKSVLSVESTLSRKGSLIKKYREDKQSLKSKQRSIKSFFDDDEEESENVEQGNKDTEKALPKTSEEDETPQEYLNPQKQGRSRSPKKSVHVKPRETQSEDSRKSRLPGGREMFSIHPLARAGRGEDVLPYRSGHGEMFSGSGFF